MEGERRPLQRGGSSVLNEALTEVQDRSKMNRRTGKTSAKKYGERGEALRDMRGVEGTYSN